MQLRLPQPLLLQRSQPRLQVERKPLVLLERHKVTALPCVCVCLFVSHAYISLRKPHEST